MKHILKWLLSVVIVALVGGVIFMLLYFEDIYFWIGVLLVFFFIAIFLVKELIDKETED